MADIDFSEPGCTWRQSGISIKQGNLAGLAGYDFKAGGPPLAFLGFVTVALTMSALMFVLALAIVLAQESLVSRLRANSERVKIWGGRILALVGLWLIALAIRADFFVQFLSG